MKKTRLLLLAGVVSAALLLASTTTDYDHSANFSKYKTYSWTSVSVQDPLWKDRISMAIDSQLTAKGWQKVASGGDASIVAVGSTKTEQTLDTWYDGGFGGGWFHRGWWGGGPGFATTTVENTPVGTLHVDIFDWQTKKVIWHGSVSDTLSGDPEKNEKKLDKGVANLFKKFPPPEKG
jgi:hypothetical protein